MPLPVWQHMDGAHCTKLLYCLRAHGCAMSMSCVGDKDNSVLDTGKSAIDKGNQAACTSGNRQQQVKDFFTPSIQITEPL